MAHNRETVCIVPGENIAARVFEDSLAVDRVEYLDAALVVGGHEAPGWRKARLSPGTLSYLGTGCFVDQTIAAVMDLDHPAAARGEHALLWLFPGKRIEHYLWGTRCIHPDARRSAADGHELRAAVMTNDCPLHL